MSPCSSVLSYCRFLNVILQRVESKLKVLERKRFGKSSPSIEVAIVGLGYSGVELAATISASSSLFRLVQPVPPFFLPLVHHLVGDRGNHRFGRDPDGFLD